MIDINAKKYVENCAHTIKVIKKDNKSVLRIKIHDVQDNFGVKSMSNMTIKATPPKAIKCRTKLGFNQLDLITTK